MNTRTDTKSASASLSRLSMCLRKCPSRFVPDTIFSELCDRLCNQYAFPFGELNMQRWWTKLCSALSPVRAPKNKLLSNLHPPKAREFFCNRKLQITVWLVGFPCLGSLALSLPSASSLFPSTFPPLPSALSPPLLSIESPSEPATVRGRYLVTTEKSIISTKQRGEKRP